jgi:hypothetical protein
VRRDCDNSAEPTILLRDQAHRSKERQLFRVNVGALGETAAIIISFVIAVAIATARSMLTEAASMARRSRPAAQLNSSRTEGWRWQRRKQRRCA